MDKLRFAVRKFDPFERSLATCWAAYQEQFAPAVAMEFVAMDLEELYSTLFAKQGLKDGTWDLVHLNTDWITEAYESNGVYPLNELVQSNPPEGGTDAWSPSLMELQTFDGQLYGLPFHDGPECLVVRKDLFESAEEKAAFRRQYGRDLAVPTTWTAFLEVADFFTRPSENLYGTVLAGYPDGHNAVFDFCLQLWSRAGMLQDELGNIRLNSPEAVEALDFYRNLFQQGRNLHPQSLQYESVKAGQAFARGEVAMMVNWFGFASWAQIDTDSAVRGRVDIAAIPTAGNTTPVSLNVYWLYAIAAGSRHQALAYDFIRFAVNAANDKKLTLAGGVGCRYSTWSDRALNEQIPFYNTLSALHEHAKTLPRLGNWPAVAHLIDEVVTSAIQSDRSSLALLDDAQLKINALL